MQAGFFTLLLHRCALRNFHVTDSQTHVIRLRVIEGPKTRDQIAFCAFHSFSKRMLATYMRRMRNNKLEVRIAGSS